MTEWLPIKAELQALHDKLLAAERDAGSTLGGLSAPARASLCNLIHYQAMRRCDVRRLQVKLSELGLSSFGHSEGHVLANLEQVMARVAEADRAQLNLTSEAALPVDSWQAAEALLHANTRAAFGPKPAGRHVYIMVTAPSASIANDDWFKHQLNAGMNILRINAAHDDASAWQALSERARRVASALGRDLRILVDLPGPKLRTLTLTPGPAVRHIKPSRDLLGRVVSPATVTFQSELATISDPNFMPTPQAVLDLMQPGDHIELQDARGRRRHLKLVSKRDDGTAVAEAFRTIYLLADTRLSLRAPNGSERTSFCCKAISGLPQVISVAVGEQVRLSAGTTMADDKVPTFSCTMPEVVEALAVGNRLLIDDGKIEASVVARSPGEVLLKIVRASHGSARIRGDMGINLPDTDLNVPALSDRDDAALRFLQAEADLVGLSFVRSVDDVRALEERLTRKDLGLVLKIETRAGFENLPKILGEAVGRRPLAIMIARGDLAVEVGFERLAEVQEEILWLCEAAHIPVIWATQVLESLAKTGIPTRAEITDAAMSVRAECVMLNKGPFIENATVALDSILRRMEGHVYKKRQLYRPLNVAR